MNRTFTENVEARNQEGYFLCAGLDPVWGKMHIDGEPSSQKLTDFGKRFVDATAPFAAVIKPQVEMWDAMIEFGSTDALTDIIEYAHSEHPEVPIILDAKQGDIGSTNSAALERIFGVHNADAMTIHPWMGKVAMETHWSKEDKGFIVIAKTSNPGSSEFQDMPIPEGIDIDLFFRQANEAGSMEELRRQYLNGGLNLGQLLQGNLRGLRLRPLWQVLAQNVTNREEGWNKNNNMGIVVGATYRVEAESARANAGDSLILSPGLGTQGGSVVDMRNHRGTGVVYNSSSALMLPTEAQVLEYGGTGELSPQSVARTIGVLAEQTDRLIRSELGIVK